MDAKKIAQDVVETVARGILELNNPIYGNGPGTVTAEQAEERARNIAQVIVGRYQLERWYPEDA